MSAHSELSPSAAHRWIACPASVQACRDIPAGPSNKYSREGTAAHDLAAKCLMLSVSPMDFLGDTIEVEGETFVVDDGMAHYVGIYVDAIMQRVAEFGADLEVEASVRLEFLAPGTKGTADAILRYGETVEVHDLKYGRGVQVSAQGNEQLRLYAAGAAEVTAGAKRVAMFIHQPRLDWTDSEELGIGELREWKREAIFAARLAMGDHAPFKAGEHQCRWCPFLAQCPAASAAIADATGATFADLTDDAPAEASPEAITVGQNMQAVEFVQNWAKAVQERAKELLNAGESVPGWKLVQGRAGNRQWDDEEAVEKLMKKSFRFKDADVYTKKLITPTVAEKTIAKKYPKRWAKCEEHITRGAPSVALVPESDKRPAVSVANDFDNLENLL